MKSISTALQNHLAQETTSLATCWKLTLTSGTVFGFTDHDKDITYSGTTYQASAGFTPSAISTNDGLSVDNLDVEGVIDSINIKEQDILAGKFDFAEIEIFLLNYSDLTQGKIQLKRGWLGEISFSRNQFITEVRGLSQRLIKTIGALYSPSCRASLGDSRCKVTMTTYTKTGTVTGVNSSAIFYDTARIEAKAFFNFGKLIFTSGLNSGIQMEVKEYKPGQIVLVLPMPYQIAIGDTYSVQAGCDKTFGTCISKFSNAINFRGEPDLPGIDRILQTSSTRTTWQ